MPDDLTRLFNRIGFLERLEKDDGLMREILKVYVAEVPVRKESFARAAQARDYAALGKLAHALKGSSATIKAESVRELALNLEAACKGADGQSCLELCNDLLDELDLLTAHLNDILAESD